MLTSPDDVKPDKIEDSKGVPIELFQELDNEVKLLSEEIANLQSVEKTLLAKIEEEIENKRRTRDELKKQAEELRIKCDELTKIYNSFIQA